MKFTADGSHVRSAIDRIKLDLEDKNNVFKSITLMADERGGGVFATDSIAYIESRFDATVEEPGQCQIVRTLGQILANVHDDAVTLSLNKSKLVIDGSNGFKGRLQTMAGQGVAYEVVGQKIASIDYAFQGVFNKHDLASLIRLSTILPETENEVVPCRYIALYINEDAIVGATHESAVGAVESVPIPLIRYETITETPIKIVLDSTRFKSLLDICGSEVILCASTGALEHRDPVRVSDETGVWWGMMSQMLLKSEQ